MNDAEFFNSIYFPYPFQYPGRKPDGGRKPTSASEQNKGGST
jgi:hypothetical protein